MGSAIAQAVPLGIGVAISPLPVVAIVLLLVATGGREKAIGYMAGWIVGLAVPGAIMLALTDRLHPFDHGVPADWIGKLKLALGALLILGAAAQLLLRSRRGPGTPTPRWMGALDTLKPVKAWAAGIVMAGPRPKNLLLALAATAGIAESGISTSRQVAVFTLFVVVGTAGVAAPLALSLAMGDRSQTILGALKDWMTRNYAAITSVVLVVLGGAVLAMGIDTLAS